MCYHFIDLRKIPTISTAFRIHISHITKEMLDELKGYSTVYRGEVELKVSGQGIICISHSIGEVSKLYYKKYKSFHILVKLECCINLRWFLSSLE